MTTTEHEDSCQGHLISQGCRSLHLRAVAPRLTSEMDTHYEKREAAMAKQMHRPKPKPTNNYSKGASYHTIDVSEDIN